MNYMIFFLAFSIINLFSADNRKFFIDQKKIFTDNNPYNFFNNKITKINPQVNFHNGQKIKIRVNETPDNKFLNLERTPKKIDFGATYTKKIQRDFSAEGNRAGITQNQMPKIIQKTKITFEKIEKKEEIKKKDVSTQTDEPEKKRNFLNENTISLVDSIFLTNVHVKGEKLREFKENLEKEQEINIIAKF